MLETARTWGVSGTSGISASSPHSISRSSDAPTGRSRRTRRPRTDGHRADGHRVAGHRVAGHRVAGHRADRSPGVRMAAASSTWVSRAPRRRYSARTRAHTARKRRSPLESTPLRLSSATLPAWNPHTCGQHWQPCQRGIRTPVDSIGNLASVNSAHLWTRHRAKTPHKYERLRPTRHDYRKRTSASDVISRRERRAPGREQAPTASAH